jgi:hypothetical protein
MKRIAFIKDGVVLLVLNCDPKLYNAILTADAARAVTDEDPTLTTGWSYDGTEFAAPVVVVE